MNRGELIRTIAAKEGIACVKAGKSMNSIMKNITQSLESGEKVMLSGFGSFRLVRRQAQKVRNPHTGEKLLIPARNVARFRPSKMLLAKVR